MNDTIVLALRGGSYTAPLHSASISGDGRWVRVPSAALIPLDGAPVPEEATVALGVNSYGRSWAAIVSGAVVPTAEQAVAAIRNAQPALELAQRILQGRVAPAAVPATAADDLDDE